MTPRGARVRSQWKWTASDIATIEKLWRAGQSASQIGRVFHVTRNTIIGIVNRHIKDPSDRVRVPTAHTEVRSKRAAQSHAVVKMRRKRARKPVQPKPPTLPETLLAAVPTDEPASLNITLTGLRDHHCRYAHGDRAPYLFCGHDRIDGSAYCLFHHRLCWRRKGDRERDRDREAA